MTEAIGTYSVTESSFLARAAFPLRSRRFSGYQDEAHYHEEYGPDQRQQGPNSPQAGPI